MKKLTRALLARTPDTHAFPYFALTPVLAQTAPVPLQCITHALALVVAPVPAVQVVHIQTLNPKCVSLAELYGAHDPNTDKWADGLAGAIVRAAAMDDSSDQHWVVFDGPLDAAWVEGLNTGACVECEGCC